MTRNAVWALVLGILLTAAAGAAATSAAVAGAAAENPDPQVLMREGDDAYESGDYLKAIEVYRSILDGGLTGPDLDYNLGNAYLKSGQLGWAVLYYERARRLAPLDEDIRANLEYARSRMVDVLPETKSPPLVSLLMRAHNLLALRALLWLACALWFSIAALAILSVFRERSRAALRVVNLVLAGVLGLCLVSAGFKIYDREARHSGVVVADEAQVMSGPGEEYAREFVLHAGTRIDIKRTYGDWYEVALSDEMRGWVPVDRVEGI